MVLLTGLKDEIDKSIADYIKTVELDSNYTNAYYYLGNAYWLARGEFTVAIAHYGQSARIRIQNYV